jgi:hypothetical protein
MQNVDRYGSVLEINELAPEEYPGEQLAWPVFGEPPMQSYSAGRSNR